LQNINSVTQEFETVKRKENTKMENEINKLKVELEKRTHETIKLEKDKLSLENKIDELQLLQSETARSKESLLSNYADQKQTIEFELNKSKEFFDNLDHEIQYYKKKYGKYKNKNIQLKEEIVELTEKLQVTKQNKKK